MSFTHGSGTASSNSFPTSSFAPSLFTGSGMTLVVNDGNRTWCPRPEFQGQIRLRSWRSGELCCLEDMCRKFLHRRRKSERAKNTAYGRTWNYTARRTAFTRSGGFTDAWHGLVPVAVNWRQGHSPHTGPYTRLTNGAMRAVGRGIPAVGASVRARGFC